MKKQILSLLLAAAMLLCLCACETQSKETVPGYYTLTHRVQDGKRIEVTETTVLGTGQPAFLLIEEDGTAAYFNGTELLDCTWKDNTLVPSAGGEAMQFVVKADTFELTSADGILLFTRSESSGLNLDAVREALSRTLRAGYYVFDHLESGDDTVTAEMMEDAFLLLYDDGTGVMYALGELLDMRWDEDSIGPADAPDDKVAATCFDGVLTMERDGGLLAFAASDETPPDIDALRESLTIAAGYYVIETMTSGGVTLTAADLEPFYEQLPFLILNDDGSAVLYDGMTLTEMIWGDGSIYPAETPDEALPLRADSGTLLIEDGDERMTFTPSDAAPPNLDILRNDSFWAEDWYGWWIMHNCTGDYEGMENYWWDLCAELSLAGDGSGTFVLWDEDYTKAEPMSEVLVSLKNNVLYSRSGYFETGSIGEGDWAISPEDSTYERCLVFVGEVESTYGSYQYMVILRPWGTLWDDVVEDDLPYYYTDWYLPLIEAGMEMPDYIETE